MTMFVNLFKENTRPGFRSGCDYGPGRKQSLYQSITALTLRSRDCGGDPAQSAIIRSMAGPGGHGNPGPAGCFAGGFLYARGGNCPLGDRLYLQEPFFPQRPNILKTVIAAGRHRKRRIWVPTAHSLWLDGAIPSINSQLAPNVQFGQDVVA